MVTADEIRALAVTLPRTEVHVVHDRLKFRIKSIVYLAFSRDEKTMGFGYPKEERAAVVESEPAKFFLPGPSDMRFNWVCAWLAALDHDEMTELVCGAWAMCVPKFLIAERLGIPNVRATPRRRTR